MATKTRLQKYHEQKVVRTVTREVAATPAARQVEKRAIQLEQRGMCRRASRLWLECMDKAIGEIERARIAIRREQCIKRSNGLCKVDYNGINSGACIDLWGSL